MTALCKPYATIAEAEQAVADLIAAGVPGEDVRLLMGAEIHDARRETRGRFAGSVAPEERVGAFEGEGPKRSALRGSFAGAADGAEGTFANADRDVVVTHHDGKEQTRVAGHAKLKALLMEAGLDDLLANAADADLRVNESLTVVRGIVEGGGRTQEHEHGWRAQYALPVAIIRFTPADDPELRERVLIAQYAASERYGIPLIDPKEA